MSDYYVLFSSTSRNGMRGLTPRVTYADDQQIAEWAFDEVIKSGVTLEDLAGIECVENENDDLVYARELTPEETLEMSIQKLGDDGRLFRVFTNAGSFIEAAEEYGLEDAARKLVEEMA